MIVIPSLVLWLGAFNFLRVAPYHHQLLFAWCMGVLVVCSLPGLVALRRRFWKRRFAGGGGWMRTVGVLLWMSLFIAPVVTGASWLWYEFSEARDGMTNLQHFLGFLVCALTSVYAAYGLAVLAFLIQLWRDQWRPKLSVVTLGYLYLFYVALVWICR